MTDQAAREDGPGSAVGAREPRLEWWRRRSLLWIAAAVLLVLWNYRHAASRPVSSDGAVNVLQAADLLRGNLLLTHWQLSDVSFYLSDLPLYAVLVLIFGSVPAVVHLGAAIVFTAVVLLSAALAQGRSTGREGALRALLAGVIVFGTPIGSGDVNLYLSSPDHISTVALALLVLLVIARAAPSWRTWLVVLVLAVAAEISDALAIVVLALPVVLVCGLRAVRRLPGWRHDAWLSACMVVSVGLTFVVEAGLRAAGGFTLYKVGADFNAASLLPSALAKTWHEVLALFGADFTGRSFGLTLAIPVLHLCGLALATAAILVTARRFFGAVDRIDQILLVASAGNLAAFALTLQAFHGTAREFLPVLAFGAVLASRQFAGPLLRLRLVRAVAVVLAGYLAVSAAVLFRAPSQVEPNAGQNSAELAAWLQDNHLTYGLGSYWNASEITVQSRGAVRVRPVSVVAGRIAVMDTEFDRTWYDPATNRATYLVVKKNDHWMRKVAEAEYGAPVRTVGVARSWVLIWDRNLLPVDPSVRDR
ncbi:MAG TPA: hypothetical protein VNW94_00870 [Streptosporangiaceae bacterium]|nr:hypothetical protein [Streptosporangiaceae bacterium]